MKYIKTTTGLHRVWFENEGMYFVQELQGFYNAYTSAQVFDSSSDLQSLCDLYLITVNDELLHTTKDLSEAKAMFGSLVVDINNNCKLYGATWIKGKFDEPSLRADVEFVYGEWKLLNDVEYGD